MGVARVTISALFTGQVNQNVIHLDYGETSYDANAIQLKIQSDWIPTVKTVQVAQFVYNKIAVRNMSVIGGLTSEFVVSIAGGAGSASNLWGPLAFLLSLHSATGGHNGRGRVYLGGSYAANMINGIWSDSVMSLLTTMSSTLTTKFTGATPTSGYNLTICKRENLPTSHPVVLITPRNIPAVQRRRNIGVGF